MIIYEEILRTFQEKKVKYILVGGIAFNLHGGMRATVDLDLLVEMSSENLRKIVQILKAQGYKVRQPVDPMGIADEKTRETWVRKKHMKDFNFFKDEELKEVDIVIESPVSYEKAQQNVTRVRVGDLTLNVISIDDLINMKRKAGRPVDRLDIEELKKIKKMMSEQ